MDWDTDENGQSAETPDLREIFLFFWRHAWIIAAAAIVFGSAGWLVSTRLLVPQYSASATVIINKAPEIKDGVTYNDILLTQKLVQTYTVIMQSETVLSKAAEALGGGMTAGRLKKLVAIAGVKNTEILKVTVVHPDPVLAAAAANEIVRQATAEIIRTAKVGSVEVVDWAVVPNNPVKPNKRNNTLLAFMLGGIAATGICFLWEKMDNTFKSDEDIKRRYGLPVLGVLPLFRPEDFRNVRKGAGS